MSDTSWAAATKLLIERCLVAATTTADDLQLLLAPHPCHACLQYQLDPCPLCFGEGTVPAVLRCVTCDGTGGNATRCPTCHGRGASWLSERFRRIRTWVEGPTTHVVQRWLREGRRAGANCDACGAPMELRSGRYGSSYLACTGARCCGTAPCFEPWSCPRVDSR